MMRRLFLSSSFDDVKEIFSNVFNDYFADKTVAFIPTAAFHEEMNFYVTAGKNALKQLGMNITELEISTATLSEIQSTLQNSDIIYVSGGNTFFLLQELKKTGADKIITEHIKLGKIYIGESAGSIVLAPNIEYVSIMDNPTLAEDLINYNGLNIVDFYPLPHNKEFPFKKATEKIRSKYGTKLKLKPINNSQAILVQGNAINIMG